mmetsp:Transcript_91250/g.295018  ORF Transcript_91250/g.295018 Transcript_91250/m.295018 type:complete len:313 (-) Transcript_91250:43-981(-)|eukprot:CAMPEP_0203859352 /NCGR_PEP_ID=MMETSP0359-20131031/11793_1 /ASSEMBLY_ACC=CAM_ASM_000338 /TAXON_ID=268821 /ORGANISM="Scrippsiella Hangoei, Strain SHTV-5" /LENGTH=312 /DNA_ID=CAMNT_0050776247 /DNA_START=78 /DNA_END=1016 /DNA_ORIENTATION=+
MAFWGCTLKAGQKQKIDVPSVEVLHVSQVCLHDPKPGKNYLQVQVDGQSYTIGFLEQDKVECLAMDLFFGSEGPTFVNTGKSEIHLSGYTEPKGSIEELGYEEEVEPPAQGGAKAVGSSTAAAKASPKAPPKAAAKIEPAKKAAAAPAEGDEEQEEEEEEEDEGEESEEEAAPKSAAKAPAAAPAAAAKAAVPKKGGTIAKAAAKAPPAPAPASPAKRKASEASEGTAAAPPAPPAKKAKEDAPPASPKAGSSNDAAYLQAIVDYLKKSGKTKLAELGSKVKRPEGVSKMKTILGSNKDKFLITGDAVELKK